MLTSKALALGCGLVMVACGDSGSTTAGSGGAGGASGVGGSGGTTVGAGGAGPSTVPAVCEAICACSPCTAMATPYTSVQACIDALEPGRDAAIAAGCATEYEALAGCQASSDCFNGSLNTAPCGDGSSQLQQCLDGA